MGWLTEYEICSLYRQAKNKSSQIPILVDLSEFSKAEIIGILLRNGEPVAKRDTEHLYKQLNMLETQIAAHEREYRAIIKALTGREV